MKCDKFLSRLEVKFASDGADIGTFSGYGAVFGNVDAYGDVIERGAFSDSLKQWKKDGRLPPMLIQHGGYMITDMDALPIGRWMSMVEDEVGLKVEGKLVNLDTERGKTIYGLMKDGVLDGMSIGYHAKEFVLGTKPNEPRRTLKKIDLVELSVVTFPANDRARVAAVKGTGMTIREFENFLREEGGFSHSQARAIASRGFKAMDPRDEDGAEIAAMIRRNIERLNPKGL